MNLEQALAEVARLTAENAELRRRAEELLQVVAELEVRLAEAERKAARQAAPFRKNDDHKLPPAEQKRPGRKANHQGARRRRLPHIDFYVDVSLDHFRQCGGSVDDCTPLTQYIEELPPVRPIVTRLTTWNGTCARCGRVHSSHPLQTSRAGGTAAVQLGPRASALALYLKYALQLTTRKAVVCCGTRSACRSAGADSVRKRIARRNNSASNRGVAGPNSRQRPPNS